MDYEYPATRWMLQRNLNQLFRCKEKYFAKTSHDLSAREHDVQSRNFRLPIVVHTLSQSDRIGRTIGDRISSYIVVPIAIQTPFFFGVKPFFFGPLVFVLAPLKFFFHKKKFSTFF